MSRTVSAGPFCVPDDFNSASARIDVEGYAALAETFGLEPAAVRAVSEIESPQGPFGPKGRPIIAPEPHVFGKQTKYRFTDHGAFISTTSWTANRYYARQGDRYEKQLALMLTLDREAALKACSWGSLQVMGFNYALAGCASVDEFVALNCISEQEQLVCAFRTMGAMGLMSALKRHDWEAFAKGWNGPAYASHGYHTKLAAAYERLKKET